MDESGENLLAIQDKGDTANIPDKQLKEVVGACRNAVEAMLYKQSVKEQKQAAAVTTQRKHCHA